jgi:hypothetical protein
MRHLLGTIWLVSGMERYDRKRDCPLEDSFLTWRAHWQAEPANAVAYAHVYDVDGRPDVHLTERSSDRHVRQYIVKSVNNLFSKQPYRHTIAFLIERFPTRLDAAAA